MRFEMKFTDGRREHREADNFETALRNEADRNGGILREINLSGRDLAGMNLTGLTFDNCDLDDADFTLANLSGSKILGRLERTSFEKALLIGARFKVEAKDINLSKAVLDMAGWQDSVIEGANMSGVLWKAENMDPIRRVHLDHGVRFPAARKYEYGVAAMIGDDPFEGAWVSSIEGLSVDQLPEHHRVLRKISSRQNIASFAVGMANSKVAKATMVGTALMVASTMSSVADTDSMMELLSSAARGIGEWSEKAMNTVTPGTVESTSMIGRLVEKGFTPALAFGAVAGGALTVMAGSALLDRMKLSEKFADLVKAQAKALMTRMGLRGELGSFLTNRARVLWSGDRNMLTRFRTLVDEASEAMKHRLLADGPGYFFVCDKKNLALAIEAMSNHASHIWQGGNARPTTFWLESLGQGPEIPAAITFVPTEYNGVEVVAIWADAGGALRFAARYDGWGRMIERADKNGRSPWIENGLVAASMGAGIQASTVFGSVLKGIKLASVAPNELFHDPNTHIVNQADDGTWMLRDIHTGKLDSGYGDVAVMAMRPDGSMLSLDYRNGTLLADNSLTPVEMRNANDAGLQYGLPALSR